MLTLFGKLFSTTLGALISGQPLKQSVQVGMSMAQIGEFAFIVATLGLSLGVISDFLFPVAVGASAITTFTTPYLIKFSEPLYMFMERRLPENWVKRLNNYSSGAQTIQAESDWKGVLKSYITIVVTNGIVLVALILLSVRFVEPFLNKTVENPTLRGIIALVVSLGVASPFLWALMAKRPNNQAYKELWLEKKYSRGPLFAIEATRILIGIAFISFWVFELFSTRIATLIAVPIIILVLVVFARRIQDFYKRIEVRFLGNLNARDTVAYNSLSETVSRKNAALQSDLLPWDAHIVQLEVPQNAAYIGRTLTELGWRERYGINIVYIKRGDRLIRNPGRRDIILPFDNLGVIGTDEQLTIFKPVLDSEMLPESTTKDMSDIVLQKVVVDEHTKLKGLDIRNSKLRERTNGVVIGIERANQRILNPESTFTFEWGDVIWIVGSKKKIDELADDAN
jgi:monovalent cation:H+ antiporter-2, CPA2 family